MNLNEELDCPKYILLLLEVHCNEEIICFSEYCSLRNWKAFVQEHVETDDDKLFYIDPISDEKYEINLNCEYETKDEMFCVYKKFTESDEIDSIYVHNVAKIILETGYYVGHLSFFRPDDIRSVISSFQEEFNSNSLHPEQCIKSEIFQRWKLHTRGSHFAPIAALCQCCGSGKSKISTTITKTAP